MVGWGLYTCMYTAFFHCNHFNVPLIRLGYTFLLCLYILVKEGQVRPLQAYEE